MFHLHFFGHGFVGKFFINIPIKQKRNLNMDLELDLLLLLVSLKKNMRIIMSRNEMKRLCKS
jgi:hypothetical protein